MGSVPDTGTTEGGRGVTDGLLKVLETLGDKIIQVEGFERWANQQKQDAQKQLNTEIDNNCRLNVENGDLRKQLFDANDKITKYEGMVFIAGDGKEIKLVELPEIQTLDELIREVNKATERGVAPTAKDDK